MTPSRRTVLSASGVLAAAAALPARAATVGDTAWLQAVVERYAGFGIKAAGGPGDKACDAWLEGELRAAGYVTERHGFQVPFFEPANVTLASGSARAAVIPQAVVTPTGPAGVTGPLRLADRPGDLAGAIALVDLPFKRWGGIADPQFPRPVAVALRRGAAAVVAITNGPSGEAVALNARPDRPAFDRPVAILAPKDAAPFLVAAGSGSAATLTVDGRGGRRPAWNLIGRLDRKADQTLVMSTPRSGWFTCAAERGSGLAAWLALAHWLAAERRKVNDEVLATSGHEYIYLGGEKYLSEKAPPPARTRLWTHIGASLAARDWHELGGGLRPLPSVDPQRVLTATADILPGVKAAFRGLPGLEATYPADRANAGGELVNVIEAGYRTAIGEYGIHRFFHTRGDDLRCVSGELVRPAALAFRAAMAAVL
jgi:hypothetical protein